MAALETCYTTVFQDFCQRHEPPPQDFVDEFFVIDFFGQFILTCIMGRLQEFLLVSYNFTEIARAVRCS